MPTQANGHAHHLAPLQQRMVVDLTDDDEDGDDVPMKEEEHETGIDESTEELHVNGSDKGKKRFHTPPSPPGSSSGDGLATPAAARDNADHLPTAADSDEPRTKRPRLSEDVAAIGQSAGQGTSVATLIPKATPTVPSTPTHPLAPTPTPAFTESNEPPKPPAGTVPITNGEAAVSNATEREELPSNAGPAKNTQIRFNDALNEIRAVLPDISTAYVKHALIHELAHERSDPINRVIRKALEHKGGYPISRNAAGRSGKKAEQPDEGVPEEDYRSVNFKTDERSGAVYDDKSHGLLFELFPSIPVHHIVATLPQAPAFTSPLPTPSYRAQPVGVDRLLEEVLVDETEDVTVDSKPVVERTHTGLTAYILERNWLGVVLKKDRAERAAKLAKQEADAIALANGEGMECGCCFHDKLMDDMFQCNEGHLFCRDCVTTHAKTQLGQEKHVMSCIDTSLCSAIFPDSEIDRLLPPEQLQLYYRLKQAHELELANIDGLESCPYCHFSAIIDNPDERLFRCLAPDCGRVSCRACKKEEHLPKTCAEMEADRKLNKRHIVEDAMSAAMIRNCSKCKFAFVKEDGCNKMTCPKCRTVMCYVCRKVVENNYDHFDRRYGAHNLPPVHGKCLLYDANERVKENAAIIAARDTAQGQARQAAAAEGVELAEADIHVDAPQVDRRAVNIPLPQLRHHHDLALPPARVNDPVAEARALLIRRFYRDVMAGRDVGAKGAGLGPGPGPGPRPAEVPLRARLLEEARARAEAYEARARAQDQIARFEEVRARAEADAAQAHEEDQIARFEEARVRAKADEARARAEMEAVALARFRAKAEATFRASAQAQAQARAQAELRARAQVHARDQALAQSKAQALAREVREQDRTRPTATSEAAPAPVQVPASEPKTPPRRVQLHNVPPPAPALVPAAAAPGHGQQRAPHPHSQPAARVQPAPAPLHEPAARGALPPPPAPAPQLPPGLENLRPTVLQMLRGMLGDARQRIVERNAMRFARGDAAGPGVEVPYPVPSGDPLAHVPPEAIIQEVNQLVERMGAARAERRQARADPGWAIPNALLDGAAAGAAQGEMEETPQERRARRRLERELEVRFDPNLQVRDLPPRPVLVLPPAVPGQGLPAVAPGTPGAGAPGAAGAATPPPNYDPEQAYGDRQNLLNGLRGLQDYTLRVMPPAVNEAIAAAVHNPGLGGAPPAAAPQGPGGPGEEIRRDDDEPDDVFEEWLREREDPPPYDEEDHARR